jgi:hypothetical protein
MKTINLLKLCLCRAFLGAAVALQAQGTLFQNLDFELADPSGYPPNSNDLPVGSGFPGWAVTYSSPGVGTKVASAVWYDALSIGGAIVCIDDRNTGYGFVPPQGTYAAYLFGGPAAYWSGTLVPVYSTISQTGWVPSGTHSLLMDVSAMNGFTVSLGGQALNMLPLQTFSSYTLYGADISGFAGLTAQLSITAPPTGVPNGVLLDDIVFSPQVIPEPGAVGLLGLCAGLYLWSRRRKHIAV